MENPGMSPVIRHSLWGNFLRSEFVHSASYENDFRYIGEFTHGRYDFGKTIPSTDLNETSSKVHNVECTEDVDLHKSLDFEGSEIFRPFGLVS